MENCAHVQTGHIFWPGNEATAPSKTDSENTCTCTLCSCLKWDLKPRPLGLWVRASP